MGATLFAPVAAALARGGSVPSESRPADWMRQRDWPDDLAEIVYVDHYGNAITGLRAAILGDSDRIRVAGRNLARARTFGDVPSGEAIWYENSNSLAEIAVNQGRADQVLHLAVSTPISIIS